MNRLLNPELYVMLLCHNYENASIHIVPEELVSFSFTFYVQILTDVHVCIYIMFYMFLLFLLNCYWVLRYFVRNDEIKLYNQ